MYQPGEFVEINKAYNKIAILIKPFKSDGYTGWICMNNFRYFRLIRHRDIIGRVNLDEEEKQKFYDWINGLEYSGKYEHELMGIKTDKYKITTRYEVTCLRVQEIIDRCDIKLGDFLEKETSNDRYFLVVKILPDALILYVEDTDGFQNIYDPKYIIGVASLDQERKNKIYAELNSIVYGGKHVDIVRNIKTEKFSIITKLDYVANPLSVVEFGKQYKECNNYHDSIPRISFNEDNSINFHLRDPDNPLHPKGVWQQKGGQLFLIITSNKQGNVSTRKFILRAYPNYQIRLFEYFHTFKEEYSQYWSHLIDFRQECIYF